MGENNSSQTTINDRASLEIVAKIKEIAREHPGTDPLPQPWSEGEYQKDLAVASGEPQDFKVLEAEIVSDFLQILATAQNIHVVIAIIYHRGKLLAGAVSGSKDKTVRVWDLETGACLRILTGHSSFVQSVSVTPDGRRAVTGSPDL